MQVIKSFDDIDALREAGLHSPDLLGLVARRMQEVIRIFKEDFDIDWDPEEYGAFVLVEPEDTAATYAEVGLNREEGLLGACWESCFRREDEAAFELLVLYSGDTGWTFFVPDAAWVPSALRAKLEDEATAPPAGLEEPAGLPF